jgi:hypothetical protein
MTCHSDIHVRMTHTHTCIYIYWCIIIQMKLIESLLLSLSLSLSLSSRRVLSVCQVMLCLSCPVSYLRLNCVFSIPFCTLLSTQSVLTGSSWISLVLAGEGADNVATISTLTRTLTHTLTILTYAHLCSPMLTYAHVYRRCGRGLGGWYTWRQVGLT